MELWRELRFVAREIGLEQAQKLSVEVRRWWIDQMNRDIEQRRADWQEQVEGKKTVPIK